MPHSCRAGKQPLTWEELRKLPDRAPVYVDITKEPYACVLRWEFGDTACFCTFDPATMDTTLVLRRCDEVKFKKRGCKVWRRVEVPTSDEIVASEPQMTRPVDAGFYEWLREEESSDE